MSNIDSGKLEFVLEGLKQGEYPANVKHLIHDVLRLSKVDLVVDKEKCRGGDLALKGNELNSIGVTMVIINFDSENDRWELNPVKKFGVLISSDALPSVKNLIKSLPDYIENSMDGTNYGAGHKTLIHLIESSNEQGILVAYKKTTEGAELMIEECGISNNGVQVWLRNVSKMDC